MPSRILVLDDEPSIRELIASFLGARHEVTAVASVDDALRALRETEFDAVTCDLNLPESSGEEFLRRALLERPLLGAVVVTGHGSLERLGELSTLGVADYCLKPFRKEELRLAVERAVALSELRAAAARLRSRVPVDPAVPELVGDCASVRRVKHEVARAAPTESTVLVTGETGTGKEVVARALHRLSRRCEGPFISVNCGALSPGLVESELFGHARGAFTGADRERDGLFGAARGGTLFLDEVSSISQDVQVRLLRALSTGDVVRVGESKARPSDVRIVAATNVDLAELVERGEFRTDLYYRLAVIDIRLPTLRERGADEVEVLARRLTARVCDQLGRPLQELGEDALECLRQHDWPGNVRELIACLQRAIVASGEGQRITASHVRLGSVVLPEATRPALPENGLDLRRVLLEAEQDLVRQALERSGGSKAGAARLLGIERTTLVKRLSRLQVEGVAS